MVGLKSSDSKGCLRVLHVDDDTSILEVSKQILMMEDNFEIDCALSVGKAFKKLGTGHFDVVVSDYEMPQKDGLEFLKELREQKNEIPFILFTGKDREEVAIKALNLGADRYYHKKGSPETVYGEFANGINLVAAHKKANDALIESEDKRLESQHFTKKILDATPNLIYIYDLIEQRNVYANKKILDFLGYAPKQVEAMGSELFANILHPDDAEAVAEHHARFANASDKAMYELEYRMKHSSGEWRWLHSRDILFSRTPEGKGKQILGSCEDITERKKSEEKLVNLKAFDERIIDSLGDALIVIDPEDYRIISANEVALKQLKLCKKELTGKTCYQTIHHLSSPCQLPEHACPIQEVLKTGNLITVEHTHLDENNNQRIVEVSAHPVTNPDGKTVIIHVARDITERKQMETKSREAEKRYRALFDWAPSGILIIDPQTGKPVEFNEVAHEQLDYSREEFAKLHIYEYKVLETPDETNAIIQKILCESKAEWETKHRTKNGEIRDVVIVSRVIELSGTKLLQSMYRDVTEAKKVEVALRDSEAKYCMLVELAQEGIWALDTDNCTVYVNPRMAEMLGYAGSEMIGKNLAAFLDNPDMNFLKQNLEGCKLGHRVQCEFNLIRKDGTRIYASTAVSQIQDDYGNCCGSLVLVVDITERKRMEQKIREDGDRIAAMNEKLRVVGGLTSHDVRNKLMVSKSNVFLLKKLIGDKPELSQYLEGIDSALNEADRLFDFSGLYEKIGSEELIDMDVEQTFNDAAALFLNLQNTKIVNQCQNLTVQADSLLRQLFYNLIDNSLKHGEKVNQIRMHYRKEDDMIKMFYEDNGVGVSEANKLKLFTEGFTTGNGSGLGLKLIKRMVEVYGWILTEEGEPGKGAKFTITIPKESQQRQNIE